MTPGRVSPSSTSAAGRVRSRPSSSPVSAPRSVTAVDPSEPFVAAARARHPDVDVRQASAEELPFADGSFDRALAQLVVHFMADPVAGLGEMRRVTREGGLVAACVWDHGGGTGPLSPFWSAVRSLDPAPPTSPACAGSNEGDLTRLFGEAGLQEVEEVSARRRGRACDVRRVVGAVHLRCRPRRRLCPGTRRRGAHGAPGALPCGARRRAVRGRGPRLVGPRAPMSFARCRQDRQNPRRRCAAAA